MPSEAFAFFAERSVDLLKMTGERVPLTIRIGIPYPKGDVWYCALTLQGLSGSPPDLWGRDSYGALLAALTLVRSVLSALVTAGGRIVFPSSDTDIELIDFATGQSADVSNSGTRHD